MKDCYPNIIYTTNEAGFNDLDCATCPNKPDPNKNVFGDTPCTWCIKRRVTCK